MAWTMGKNKQKRQIGLERSASGSLILIHGPRGSRVKGLAYRVPGGQGWASRLPGAGVSKSRYINISLLVKYSKFSRFYKKLGPFYKKNSDVISLVIDQSQPGVFYLQKMMNFMKPGVFTFKK